MSSAISVRGHPVPLTLVPLHPSIIRVLVDVLRLVPIPLLKAREAEVVTRGRVNQDYVLTSGAAGGRLVSIIAADDNSFGAVGDRLWG